MIKILSGMMLVCVCLSQYDMHFSQFLDRYSAITHCNEEQIKTWKCKLCQSTEKPQNITYIYNQYTNILGFMGYISSLNAIIISWRGTVDVKNWIEDFTFYQVAYSSCRNCFIHEGFYLSFLSVKQFTLSALSSLTSEYPSADIIVTGSSLGGALATVSAIEIQLRLGKVKELHVFGCPRVGNDAFSKFLQDKIGKIYRVIHNHDIVPHVPLQSQNFHHPATEILFDEKMVNYKICDNSGEDPSCSNSYSPNYTANDHVTYWQQPDLVDLCTL